jgi:hypothetical protein
VFSSGQKMTLERGRRMGDELIITVLPDGRIRTSAGKISAVNHANAEQFLAFMARLLGGKTTVTKRKEAALEREHTHEGERHTH